MPVDPKIAREYYSRPEVYKELMRLSKNREVQAWFGEIRGRRPEIVNFEGDIKDLIKQGMTSFHVSEERWHDPLNLETGLAKKQLDELRQGWDCIIDLDSKNLDLSFIVGELIIDALKFHEVKHYYVKFSVTGETPVLIEMNNKIDLIPISKAVEFYNFGNKLKVLSMDLNNKLIFSDVTGNLVHDDEIYDLYYEQSGLPLKVTGHHSVFCWSKGQVFEKKVSEIKVGDYVVSYNSSKNIFYSPQTVKNSFLLNPRKYNISKREIKVTITKRLLRLIGYYLAEGHATKTNYMIGFSFNKNELDYIEECKSLIRSLPGCSFQHILDGYPNEGSHQVIFHSKEWYTFFSEFCGVREKKHLPSFVWNLPKDYFLELLLAYIRGDAHKKSKRYLTIKSVSHIMTCQFLWLCKMHGIPANLYEEHNKPHMLPQGNMFKGSHVFMIKILRADFPLLEFNTKRHKFSKYPACRTFPVDGLKEVYYRIKPGKFIKHRFEHSVFARKKRSRMDRIKRVIEWFENYHALPIDEYSRKIIDNYKNIENGDLCVLPVRKIIKKEGLHKVYDLSVKNTERFFGGCYPILLHNSGNHGLHIAIPFEAFPSEVNGVDIKNYFPDGVKVISEYLKDMIKPFLVSKILEKYTVEEVARSVGKESKDLIKDGKFEPYEAVDIDSVLISSRHLFRAVYSINEKSGLVSIPLDNIKDFKIEDAKIENVKVVRKFMNLEEVERGEAKQLLIQAFDWARKNTSTVMSDIRPTVKTIFELPKVPIKPDYFPPCILNIMGGIKQDGRKRAVFILVNFLLSIGWNLDDIDKFLVEWNKKNIEPLLEGYIRSQISWFKRQNKKVLPPNCENTAYYKSMGIKCDDNICFGCKNPVNYAIRRARLVEKEINNSKNTKIKVEKNKENKDGK